MVAFVVGIQIGLLVVSVAPADVFLLAGWLVGGVVCWGPGFSRFLRPLGGLLLAAAVFGASLCSLCLRLYVVGEGPCLPRVRKTVVAGTVVIVVIVVMPSAGRDVRNSVQYRYV